MPSRCAILAISTLILWLALFDFSCADPPAKPNAGAAPAGFQQSQALLRQRCYSCHGPEKQEGGLRLDSKSRAFDGGDSGRAVQPGRPDESLLIERVSAADREQRMPPEGEGTPLSPAEIKTLRDWIAAGADWPADFAEAAGSRHWSFQPIRSPAIPVPARGDWGRNPIDAFVLAKLEGERLQPSPEADRPTLIRRVYLDVLGIPPTIDQLDRFLNDSRPDAYQRMVDEALESKHYGERWGRHWLDLARYADSDGYEKDRPRPNAWRYRQWVIEAFNQDLPFDQFTIEQIAGDMLPGADVPQRLAVGFHRNTLHNTEGGTDQEEDRVKKSVDRINTIGSIWLGLTVACAQCHSHKYDPLTQREYYQLYAFVNSVDEHDAPAPTPKEKQQLAAALKKHEAQAAKLAATREKYLAEELDAAQRKWEAGAAVEGSWTPLTPLAMTSRHGASLEVLKDQSVLASGTNQASDLYAMELALPHPTASLRLEVLPDKRLPQQGPGRADNGNFVLTAIRIARVSETAGGAETDAPAVAVSAARADFSQKDWDVAKAVNDSADDGWAVSPQIGKRHTAVFVLSESVTGRIRVELDQKYNGGSHNLGRFRWSASSRPDTSLDGLPSDVLAALQVPSAERGAEQLAAIRAHYQTVDPRLAELDQQLAQHQAARPKGPAAVAQSVVERPAPRETRILLRGDFLNPGEAVEPAGAAFLPPIEPREPSAPLDRLDFAQWLVAAEQPLTARVTVNRIWQRYFQRGIVATSDDFGEQGARPSHPELLDYLAGELRDNGWRLKHIHRLILNSATYRQQSAGRPELEAIDPDNELLARQVRRRVEAEIVRDLALAVSGQLDPRIGGPSVHPPQPAEYSSITYANSAKWKVSQGGDRYRRGLYTFFQRTSPYPMLMTFDSPDSTECTAQRSESNTPLQALTVWNDQVFFETSRALGRRIVAEVPAGEGESTESLTARRVEHAFRLCLSRGPTSGELRTLTLFCQSQRELCERSPADAEAIAGDPPAGAGAAELAAWTLTSRVLLNLDEFINRN